MKQAIRKVSFAGALVLVMSIGLVDTASAAHVTCGQTITQDTTLDSDVGPCTGDGVVVGASGISTNPITLNLNGRSIRGGLQANTAGVRIEGKTYVEVKGPGTATQFAAGVALRAGSQQVTISGVTVNANVGSLLSDFGDGVLIEDSSNNTVAGSTISGNGPYGGVTLLGDSDFNKVGVAGQGNTIKDNNVPSGTSNQDDGVRFEPKYDVGTYPNNNTVEANTIKGNGLDGVAIFANPVGVVANTANTIKSNIIDGNGLHTYSHRKGDGVHVFTRANGNTITTNKVTGNAASGIVIELGSTGNSITSNTVSGNGVFVDPLRPAFDQYDKNSSTCPTGNTWSGNLPLTNTRNPTCLG